MFKMHFFLLFVQFLTGSSTLEKLELWWAMNLLMPLTIQVKCVCPQKFSGISTHNCFDLQLVFSGMQSIETYLLLRNSAVMRSCSNHQKMK